MKVTYEGDFYKSFDASTHVLSTSSYKQTTWGKSGRRNVCDVWSENEERCDKDPSKLSSKAASDDLKKFAECIFIILDKGNRVL